MPNNQNGTISETRGNASAPAKRKAAPRRDASVPPAKKKAPRESQAEKPTEILFKDLPQAGREPVAPYIWIDHPLENERLFHDHYAIRLGVGGAEQVEISLDKGEWIPCRATSGYWWHDWHGISRGKHTLTARMRTAGGQWYRTPVRSILY